MHPTGLYIHKVPRVHTLALQYDLEPHPSARLLLLSIEELLGLIFLPLNSYSDQTGLHSVFKFALLITC